MEGDRDGSWRGMLLCIHMYSVYKVIGFRGLRVGVGICNAAIHHCKVFLYRGT